MNFTFKYKKSNLSFEVNDNNVLFCAKLGKLAPIKDITQEVKQAISNPISSPSLKEIVQGKKKIVIICDDYTRPTPQQKIIPSLLDYLNSCNIRDSVITLIIATGTHRPMTNNEIVERFGEQVSKRVKIINHNYSVEECIDLGKTEEGTPIQINSIVYNADVKIGVGTVIPHDIAGWGGGAKIIQPGVSSEITTDCTHYKGNIYERPLELVGNVESFVRKEMEHITKKVGLDFIINTVVDEDRNLTGIFAGDFISAHRQAVKMAEKIYRPLIDKKADIVIINAYPANIDFWQGNKPFIYAHLAVNEGGIIIFVLDAPEGVAGGAPKHRDTILNWTAVDTDTIIENLNNGNIEDRSCGSFCVLISRLLKRAMVYCISDGLSDDEVKQLGFTPFKNIQDAIKEAINVKGENASIGIIPYGGETIVRTKE